METGPGAIKNIHEAFGIWSSVKLLPAVGLEKISQGGLECSFERLLGRGWAERQSKSVPPSWWAELQGPRYEMGEVKVIFGRRVQV